MNDFREYSAAFYEKNSLKHYGTKGMRWRRKKNGNGNNLLPGAEEETRIDGTTYTNLFKTRKKKKNVKQWFNRGGSHRG